MHHLIGLEEAGRPRPSVNQIELHPYMYQRRYPIVEYCQQNDIVIEGYSPLAKGNKLEDPNLCDIAKK